MMLASTTSFEQAMPLSPALAPAPPHLNPPPPPPQTPCAPCESTTLILNLPPTTRTHTITVPLNQLTPKFLYQLTQMLSNGSNIHMIKWDGCTKS
eukprot:6434705-Ditylum_brightwellii.AAC.1